jgi:hypothetical protein
MSATKTILDAIADRISRSPTFWGNSITVLAPSIERYDEKLDSQLLMLGVGVKVLMPNISSTEGDSRVRCDDVDIVVICVEKWQHNATTVTVQDMAESAITELQHYTALGTIEPLVFVSAEEWIPETQEESEYRQVSLKFKTMFTIKSTAITTGTPTITLGSTTVTITGPSGASFRYTLDGSNPTYESTLYAAPFTKPGVGVVINSRAFKTGEVASETATSTVT